MRKVIGGALAAAFFLSIAGAAVACPYMQQQTTEKPKEETVSS